MPLTKKGEKILHAMQEEYGKEKGKGVFYASENKGTISGVHNTQDVPEVSYRSSLPSGETLHQLNQTNRKFWQGQVGVGESPSVHNGNVQSDDQGNNWTPGERKVAVNGQAMLTPPIQASRYNEPSESLFEETGGQMAGDEHVGFGPMVKKLEGEGHSKAGSEKIAAAIGQEKYGKKGMEKKAEEGRDAVNLDPVINKSNFNPEAGKTGTPDCTRDDKEDELFPESRPGSMGMGQNPHKYLQPAAGGNYTIAIGSGQAPTQGSGVQPPVSMSGKRPDIQQVKEYKPATNLSLSDLNKTNQNYWGKNAPFNKGGK